MRVFAELRRRNVFRVGAAYLAIAWLLMQITTTLAPALHLPDWISTFVVYALLIGLAPALVLAWAFELTPEGLKRDADVPPAAGAARRTSQRLNYVIIGALVLALGYFCYDKFLLAPQREAALVESTMEAIEKRAARAQASIAVLPFTNMSTDPEQAYFADGLAEELLNLLAGIPELHVAARTSSFSFKDQNVDIRTIAEKLNVDHILEGSVRKAGETLRITAQLIDADNGFHRWSQRFDRKLEDVFAIQDEIAAQVVDALKISLLDRLPTVKPINADAYALYLKGRSYISRRTNEDLEKAVKNLQSALALEPGYAPAWVELGWAYFTQAGMPGQNADERMALARDAVDRALAADDKLGEAHIERGWLLQYGDWDWQGAEQAMQRALALEPGTADVLNGAGVLALNTGRLGEAVQLNRRAVELDPLSLPAQFNLGGALMAGGRLDEAAEAFRRVLELDPRSPYAHFSLGLVALLQKQPQAALEEMKRESDAVPRDLGVVLALSTLGREAEAERELASFVEQYKASAPYNIAAAYAWRGNADGAFEWLDTAYEQRAGELATVLSDPLLGNLKSDPRWPAFLERMGLPH